MAETAHSRQREAEGIHIPYFRSYANAAARLGDATIVNDDLGKFVLQLDDNSIWLVTTPGPVPAFAAVSTGGGPPDAHGGNHERGAPDEIDGDHLAIDFSPSFYSPDTSPPEANAVTDLTAHLKGIDNVLAGTGPHSSTHESGGLDELDGDHLDIDFAPANYVPDPTPVVSSGPGDLAAHLKGIDDVLGMAAGNMYGIDHQFQLALGRTTTTGTAPLVKVQLTTPALTGLYRVDYACVVDLPGFRQMEVEGIFDQTTTTSVSGTVRVGRQARAADQVVVSHYAFITFAGAAKDLQLRYRSLVAGRTAGIQLAALVLRRAV